MVRLHCAASSAQKTKGIYSREKNCTGLVSLPGPQGQVAPDDTAPGVTQAYKPLHHCKVGIFGDRVRSLVIQSSIRSE